MRPCADRTGEAGRLPCSRQDDASACAMTFQHGEHHGWVEITWQVRFEALLGQRLGTGEHKRLGQAENVDRNPRFVHGAHDARAAPDWLG